MRREVLWGLAALVALTLGAVGASAYARTAAPFYGWVIDQITRGHPWQVVSLEVVPGDRGPGRILRLVADVRRQATDPSASARVIARVQVGEAVETPVVFWTVLLLWPAGNRRQRFASLAVGLPIFLGLEAMTTAVQLMHDLPEASALLAGERDPITLWERWSCFLEGGGHFVVSATAAVVAASLGGRFFATRERGSNVAAVSSATRSPASLAADS
jgi:hypothetical protein